MIEKLHSAEQVAEAWEVSTSKIYRLAKSGELPSVLIGNQPRFSDAHLEAYLKSHSRETEPRKPRRKRRTKVEEVF